MIINGSGPSFEETNIRLLYKVEDPTVSQPANLYSIRTDEHKYKGFFVVMLSEIDSKICTIRLLYPSSDSQIIRVKVDNVACCRVFSIVSPYINFENGYRLNEDTMEYELDNSCAIVHSIYGIY